MGQFLLFSGLCYYPNGGWNDLVGSYDTAGEAGETARKLAEAKGHDWWHVVDRQTGEIVLYQN